MQISFKLKKNDVTIDGNGYKLNIVGPPRYKTSPAPGTFESSQVKNVTIQNLNLGETKLAILNSQHCNINNAIFCLLKFYIPIIYKFQIPQKLILIILQVVYFFISLLTAQSQKPTLMS